MKNKGYYFCTKCMTELPHNDTWKRMWCEKCDTNAHSQYIKTKKDITEVVTNPKEFVKKYI